jgi:exodeoxyribonuclease VII small subunit
VSKKRTKKRFEQMMVELEEIVSSLEESPELEEAIEAFEKGMELFRKCQTVLDESERKVRILRDGPGGDVTADLFTTGDETDGAQ